MNSESSRDFLQISTEIPRAFFHCFWSSFGCFSCLVVSRNYGIISKSFFRFSSRNLFGYSSKITSKISFRNRYKFLSRISSNNLQRCTPKFVRGFHQTTLQGFLKNFLYGFFQHFFQYFFNHLKKTTEKLQEVISETTLAEISKRIPGCITDG